MQLNDIFENFNTHEKCLKHLESLRWQDAVQCTYCASQKTTPVQNEKRHKCRSCKKSFSVMVGTIFEASKLPLHKWFLAIYLVSDAKKGISSLQLSRHLNINKDTAWYLQKRLRKAMYDCTIIQNILFNLQSTSNTIYIDDIDNTTKKKNCINELEPGGSTFDKSPPMKLNFHSLNGFWTLLNRSIVGSYHTISDRHFQDYAKEIKFKQRHKHCIDKHEILLKRMFQPKFPLSG